MKDVHRVVNLVQRGDGGRQAAVHAEDLVVDQR
jgi:hypothetical protein